MANCDGFATGGVLHQDMIVWCEDTVCINLSDPETMAEFKALMSVLVDAQIDFHTHLWTPNDEAALKAWLAAPALGPEIYQQVGYIVPPFFAENNGVAVPNANTVRLMLAQVGFPDTSESYSAFPKLAFAVETYRRSDCSLRDVESTLPPVGEAPPVPPGSGNGNGDGGGGQPRTEASTADLVGYGLAAAFVASTVFMLYRGRL